MRAADICHATSASVQRGASGAALEDAYNYLRKLYESGCERTDAPGSCSAPLPPNLGDAVHASSVNAKPRGALDPPPACQSRGKQRFTPFAFIDGFKSADISPSSCVLNSSTCSDFSLAASWSSEHSYGTGGGTACDAIDVASQAASKFSYGSSSKKTSNAIPREAAAAFKLSTAVQASKTGIGSTQEWHMWRGAGLVGNAMLSAPGQPRMDGQLDTPSGWDWVPELAWPNHSSGDSRAALAAGKGQGGFGIPVWAKPLRAPADARRVLGAGLSVPCSAVEPLCAGLGYLVQRFLELRLHVARTGTAVWRGNATAKDDVWARAVERHSPL